MPFVGRDANDNTNSPHADPPTARLVVEPDKIVQLKQGIEDERDALEARIRHNSTRLTVVPSPGEDPCSKDTVKLLGENGQTAIDAVSGYVTELDRVAIGLHDSAVAYGLIEDQNTDRFRQEPK